LYKTASLAGGRKTVSYQASRNLRKARVLIESGDHLGVIGSPAGSQIHQGNWLTDSGDNCPGVANVPLAVVGETGKITLQMANLDDGKKGLVFYSAANK